jgi:hypothetical protein
MGVVDLLEDVVKVLERKQALEREVLIYMLQGRESSRARSYARKLMPGKRFFLIYEMVAWVAYAANASSSVVPKFGSLVRAPRTPYANELV